MVMQLATLPILEPSSGLANGFTLTVSRNGIPNQTFARPIDVVYPDPILIELTDGYTDFKSIQPDVLAKTKAVTRNPIAYTNPEAFLLQNVSYQRSKLRTQGAELVSLGDGATGKVYIHPKAPDTVLKMIERGMESLFDTKTDEDIIQNDIASTEYLSRIGAGPQFLGVTRIGDRSVIVKELIDGDTVADLIYSKALTTVDIQLVQNLLKLLVRHKIKSCDLRTANIVIGATVRNPVRQAYLVDGGEILFDEQASEETLYQALWNFNSQIGWYSDAYVGTVIKTKPFKDILNDAVQPRASLLQSLRQIFENLFRTINFSLS